MQFKSRPNNYITFVDDAVIKESSDVKKIISEYNHYYGCNSVMQKYLVQPYGLKISGRRRASYSMEYVPGKSLGELWATDRITNSEFDSALSQIGEFYLSGRILSGAEGKAIAYSQIITKLEERSKTMSAYNLQFSSAMYQILERAEQAYDKLYAGDGFVVRESHGDLHLSNILWSNNKINIIDPKGIDYLWMDGAYDLAKLSHSIFSGYDFVVMDADFVSNSRAEHWLKELIGLSGYSHEAIRLNESILFASMCTMHLDRPDHIDIFLKKSSLILSEIGF